MKTATSSTVRHARSRWRVLTILPLLLVATHLAQAQWTASNAKAAWGGYNSAYLYTSGGYDHFATTIGGSTPDGFWQQAEEIEMADDAYYWAKTNDSGNLSSYSSKVNSLCNGFVARNGSSWSSDLYDDDLMWATIAFARAYNITGTSAWLTDAENNFNTVYSRGHASNGGIYWYAGCESSCSSWYENSPANWTFVIAGHLINEFNGGTGNYLSEAQSVYSWAKANLYNSSTGQIYDGYKSSGQIVGDYSYNYGTAIGAASESSEPTTITNVANYLMSSMSNSTYPYAGTVAGYNILPNYGQGATDNDGGYNGITMRWLGLANSHGSISSTVLAWARTNIGQAWSIREYSGGDPYYLMWNDWMAPTPTSGVYSWDASSALVGMFAIPPS